MELEPSSFSGCFYKEFEGNLAWQLRCTLFLFSSHAPHVFKAVLVIIQIPRDSHCSYRSMCT